MSLQNGRYKAATPAQAAEGWSLQRLTSPSSLFGANGLRNGPDGRVYVAQVAGSQISALDLASGALETISAAGSDVVAPDDVAFDAQGNLYITEYYDGRVSVRDKSGKTRVLRDDVPGANGITVHDGRLFIDECRIGGRLLELDLNGGAPRVLAENLMMPNALEAGPDGKLYFPVLGTNEIARIDPAGGTPEKVAGELGGPTAVKFDAKGRIVSTQVGSGQVLRIDPQSGERSVLAQLPPGIDNLTFVGERLFVSHFTGTIAEVLGDGKTRNVVEGGLSWPLDLAVASDGSVFIADGHHMFKVPPGGKLEVVGMFMMPGFPGNVRGLAAAGDGELLVTNANGQVSRYRPAAGENEVIAEGLDQIYGIALAPNGAAVVVEQGTGRVLSIKTGNTEVLATGLKNPVGVAVASDGSVYVAETGRVVKLAGGKSEAVIDGLQQPQGLVVHDGVLYVVDAGAKTVTSLDLKSKSKAVIARELPVGAPPGVTAKPLRGIAPFTGPQGPFAGITAGADGTLYVAADGEGSVLALRKR
ncbi:MAG: SMP-30/gluconolactonase/LRE family protein [Polyangiales bacterium]